MDETIVRKFSVSSNILVLDKMNRFKKNNLRKIKGFSGHLSFNYIIFLFVTTEFLYFKEIIKDDNLKKTYIFT